MLLLFASGASVSRGIQGSFDRVQKCPPFFGTEIEIPTDFKAPTVDRKVGLQNLGCQLWTVLKKSPILSILKINKLLEGGLWRFKQL